jgi:hypothetical protein
MSQPATASKSSRDELIVHVLSPYFQKNKTHHKCIKPTPPQADPRRQQHMLRPLFTPWHQNKGFKDAK